ncbi:hypothetical protein [Haematobacter genomosp. 1]|uniref:hypothetical protein n=1 Tax=Haematobacter genomosp. 1 TaxID=366618 RepID=UPI00117BDA21|nr:hypothetical protein [Haematobacter genomosp. 1]
MKDTNSLGIPAASVMEWSLPTTVVINRKSGGLFLVDNVSLYGRLEIIKSGSRPNPIAHIPHSEATAEMAYDYLDWIEEGELNFPFYQINGYRDENMVLSINLKSVDENSVFVEKKNTSTNWSSK